jgi:hypothetical protein
VLKRVTAAGAIAVLLIAMWGVTEPQENKPNFGLVMWSAFSCATYAELAKDTHEQQRLVNLGYRAGKKLLVSLKNNTLPETERRNLPVGVLMRLGGPSIDFIIGRIYESAGRDAYNQVVKTGIIGELLTNPSQWLQDDEVRVNRAKNKYQNANCALLR